MLDLMTVSEGKLQILYFLLTPIISSFLAATPCKSQWRGSSCCSFPWYFMAIRYHKSRFSGQNHFEEGEAWLRYAPLRYLRYLDTVVHGGSQSYPAIQCCRISLTFIDHFPSLDLGGQRGWRRRHRGHRCRARHDPGRTLWEEPKKEEPGEPIFQPGKPDHFGWVKHGETWVNMGETIHWFSNSSFRVVNHIWIGKTRWKSSASNRSAITRVSKDERSFSAIAVHATPCAVAIYIHASTLKLYSMDEARNGCGQFMDCDSVVSHSSSIVLSQIFTYFPSHQSIWCTIAHHHELQFQIEPYCTRLVASLIASECPLLFIIYTSTFFSMSTRTESSILPDCHDSDHMDVQGGPDISLPTCSTFAQAF